MKESLFARACLLVFPLLGCSPATSSGDASEPEPSPEALNNGDTVTMDGFELEAEATHEALEAVARDATVTLACSERELSYEMLGVVDDAGADMPRKILVSGCGKRAIYCCGSFGDWDAQSVESVEGDPTRAEWWCFAGTAGSKPVGACSPTLDRCASLAERVASKGVSGVTACERGKEVVCFHATRANDQAAKVFRCFPSVETCERERGNHSPAKGWGVTSACGDRNAPPPVAGEAPTGDPCAAGDGAACMKAANDLRAKGDDKGAVVLLSKACSAGEAVACLDVGRALEEGRAMDRDPERAADFYEKGCQLGANAACDAFARVRAASTPAPKSGAKRPAP